MVRVGMLPEVAAGAVGVGRATFYEWLSRGAGEHPTRRTTAAHASFAADVRQAIDESEVRLVAKIVEFVEGTRPSKRKPGVRVLVRTSANQVIAAQWLLSRRFAARWAQHSTLAVEASAGPAAATPESARAAVTKYFGSVGAGGPDES